MARYDDSPDLFGSGCGVATIGPIECEWCGGKYHQDNIDEEGDIVDQDAAFISHIEFAGKQICECCFEIIEDEILHRKEDILKWIIAIHDSEKLEIVKIDTLIDEAKDL